MPSWGSSSPVGPTTRSVAPAEPPRDKAGAAPLRRSLASSGYGPDAAEDAAPRPARRPRGADGAFAGWEMPVQYEGVISEHRAVRGDCGVFDVSHMGEFEVEGPRATELLQATLSNDLDKIAPGQAQYTLLTNERGGIIDDLIVYRLGEFRYLLVVNAANREPDLRWLKEREIPGSDVRDVSDAYVLLAVQGPRAIERLGLPKARQFTFA